MIEHDQAPGAPDTPGIEAERLSRRYGEHLAVDGVSLTVARGEVFGLLGPNGAGKTTLLRMLAGILEPSAGHARLLGIDVREEPRDAKRQLGFLSGDTALYGRLSPKETLHYFARLCRVPACERQQRVERMIQELDLRGFAEQRCESLSTGQKQRVNLARAFVADPPLLILDEPTVGLDVISGGFVIEAIGRARDADKAVLFSTHIMSEVDELCDRVGLLVRGRLRAVGPRDELLRQSGARSVGELLVRLHEEGDV